MSAATKHFEGGCLCGARSVLPRPVSRSACIGVITKVVEDIPARPCLSSSPLNREPIR
jgi:hypothetical protein